MIVPAFLGPLTSVTLRGPFAFLLDLVASAPARLRKPLPVARQDQREWCWAAVAAAVHFYLDNRQRSQCQVVQFMKPGSGCCSHPGTNACNAPFSLAKTLAAMGNRKGNVITGSLSPQDLAEEMILDAPVCCGLERAGAGHFVVITGVGVNAGVTTVELKDPSFGDTLQRVPYTALRSGYRGAVWRETYLTRRGP